MRSPLKSNTYGATARALSPLHQMAHTMSPFFMLRINRCHTLLYEAVPKQTLLREHYFSNSYLWGLILVWTVLKRQVQTYTHNSITNQFILIVWEWRRVSVCSLDKSAQPKRLVALDQVERAWSFGTTGRYGAMRNSMPPRDSDWWRESPCVRVLLPGIGLIGDVIEILWEQYVFHLSDALYTWTAKNRNIVNACFFFQSEG